MPTSTLIFALVVIVVAVLIYRPILRIARADMAERTQAGQSNAVVYALLLFPVFGPLLYLLVRRGFRPDA
ncbi:hypothetical protein [Lewinella sp. IMCC34183]|uniref:hypothetical protein n=1 Tax=Lewinella sp. IMCC34183 TaxID=2248762 RepID=UPI000E2884CF|nr:hypothetical protein [Lewinella sp. IMCC34183]